jgi:hypothetical protein
MTFSQLRNRGCSLAVALAAGLVASGCGGDDEKTSEPQRLSVGVTEQGKDKPARISVPSAVKAGLVTVELKNTGKQPHTAGLIRVDGDQTEQDITKVITSEGGPIPGWIHAAGGVAEVEPGATGTATQRLVPGTYYVLDDAEGVETAFGKFEVTEGDEGGDLPEAAANIEARDYSFTATGLETGRNSVEIVNVGKEIHHVIMAPIKSGATIEDVQRAFQQEQGEPPLDFENGDSTQALDGGFSQVTDVELRKPGKYALLCFIQDRKGGPPHVAKGSPPANDLITLPLRGESEQAAAARLEQLRARNRTWPPGQNPLR